MSHRLKWRSVCREKDVWGEDAHVFNPDRWLESSKTKRGTNVGVFSNLYVAVRSGILLAPRTSNHVLTARAHRLTFAGGVRACIGWRFA